tara:strand:+ start:22 stop:411 length:390 start_codon:yes stop_codon:yes gene_type:complete
VLDKNCISINTYLEFTRLIKFKKNKNRKLIVFIKNYLIEGFGIEWLSKFIKIIKKNYKEYNVKLYVDAGNDHGLSILLLKENIDYLKLKSNKIILTKINQIAKKNKVILNPKFNVIDLSKIKNYKNLKL